MTAAASLTDDQLDRIYIAAQTGNLAELRRAIERELAASPAAAAGVPTAHTPAVKRLIAAARAAYDHRYQSGAPINSIYEELQLAAEDISSPVAPVGAPTEEREVFEKWALGKWPGINLNRRADGEYWDTSPDGPWEAWQARALLSAQGCELATDATKQLGEPSVHLAATPIDQDFRMRPASSEAAPSAEELAVIWAAKAWGDTDADDAIAFLAAELGLSDALATLAASKDQK